MRIYEDFIDNLGQLEIVQKEDSETGQSDPADYYFIYPLPPDDKVQRQVKFVLEKNPGVIEYKLFEKQKRYEHSDLREDVFAFDTDFKSPLAALNFVKQILFAQFGDFSDGYDVVFQSPNANYILNAKTLRKIFIDGSYKTINVETPNRMYKMLPNLLYEMCCCEMMKKCYEVVDDLFKCSVNLIYQSHPSNNI